MKREKTVSVIKLMRTARTSEKIETFFGLRNVKIRNTTDKTKTMRKITLMIFMMTGRMDAMLKPQTHNQKFILHLTMRTNEFRFSSTI